MRKSPRGLQGDARPGNRRTQSAAILRRRVSDVSSALLQRRGTVASKDEERPRDRKSLHVDDDALDVVYQRIAEADQQRRDEQKEVTALCSVLPWSYETVRVLYRLGAGMTGVVFRGVHVAVARAQVAVKVVDAAQTVRRDALELQLATEHENVLRCFGTFRRRNLAYSIVSLCRKTLEALVRVEPLSTAFTFVFAARQLVAGLAYVHGQGLWHGDLKPSNVLVDQWGCLKLADFGDGKTTTPMYCAPELFDNGQMSARADVWALGVCFLFLSTGKVPWKRTDAAMALVMEIREFRPEAAGLTTGSLAARCLQHDPTARPAAAALLATEYLKQECGPPASWKAQLEPSPEEEEQKAAAYAAQRDRVSRSGATTAESLAVY